MEAIATEASATAEKSIWWMGMAEYWNTQPIPTNPTFAMALCEESVLDVATCTLGLRRLSLESAIRCVSRAAQRRALQQAGLNPEWREFQWLPGVVKAPASTMNKGVRYLPGNSYIDRLASVSPYYASIGVVEAFIPGPQYEVDGFIIGGQILFFYPLLQHWNEAGNRVTGYERAGYLPGLMEAAYRAVLAIELNDSPFCIELRQAIDGWKVIEIHARLGEDPGLAMLMCDEDPLEIIERYARG